MPDSAYKLAERLHAFSRDRKYAEASAVAFTIQGMAIEISGKTVLALELYQQSLRIHENLGNQRGVVADLGDFGRIYSVQSDYLKALEFQRRSLQINEQIGNKKGMSRNLEYIGRVYLDMGI